MEYPHSDRRMHSSYNVLVNKLKHLFLRTWEEVDHEIEDSLAGALANTSGSGESDVDPLGLGSNVKYVASCFCLKPSLMLV
jgi:hypothetical protein